MRKGLFIKVKDFTNAYHSDVLSTPINSKKPNTHFACKTILPYVSNYEAFINMSYGDEKSDVFSFGMILY